MNTPSSLVIAAVIDGETAQVFVTDAEKMLHNQSRGSKIFTSNRMDHGARPVLSFVDVKHEGIEGQHQHL